MMDAIGLMAEEKSMFEKVESLVNALYLSNTNKNDCFSALVSLLDSK